MRRLLAILLLTAALGPACKGKSKDNTKIMVAVWSDLTVPSEFNSVSFEIKGPTENSTRSFPLSAGTQLPVQFQLEPAGAKDATFTVRATALLGTTEVVSQSAHVSFVPGQALLLKLFLGRVCKGVACSKDLTCSAGVCVQTVPIMVPYDSGKPLVPPDAGAGRDSGGTFDDGGAPTDGGAGDGGIKDVRVADVKVTDAAPDAPIGSAGTGGNDGTGGTGGATGVGGSTGTVILNSGIDARPADAIATGGVDAPIGGAVGGSGGKGGTVATGGASGSGGVASSGTTVVIGGSIGGGNTASGGATVSSSGGNGGASTTAIGGSSSSGGTTAAGGSSESGGTTSSGGTTATSSTMETCVFGTGRFGNCKFGP